MSRYPVRRFSKLKGEKTSVKFITKKSFKIVEKDGYDILPSTESKIKGYVKKAIRSGTIRGQSEVKTAAAALVSAAVTSANDAKTKRVRVEHLEKGWENNIKAKGIGNCPPHRCLLRSAVERKQHLLETNDVFSHMISKLDEGL